MRTLIVEDDFTSRKLLHKLLCAYGETDVAVNGEEAVEAFRQALDDGLCYDLVCLDIVMPGMDGQEVLKRLRAMEKERGVSPRLEARVVMITALDSPRPVIEAYYRGGCTDYLVKPIEKRKLLELLREFRLID